MKKEEREVKRKPRHYIQLSLKTAIDLPFPCLLNLRGRGAEEARLWMWTWPLLSNSQYTFAAHAPTAELFPWYPQEASGGWAHWRANSAEGQSVVTLMFLSSKMRIILAPFCPWEIRGQTLLSWFTFNFSWCNHCSVWRKSSVTPLSLSVFKIDQLNIHKLMLSLWRNVLSANISF